MSCDLGSKQTPEVVQTFKEKLKKLGISPAEIEKAVVMFLDPSADTAVEDALNIKKDKIEKELRPLLQKFVTYLKNNPNSDKMDSNVKRLLVGIMGKADGARFFTLLQEGNLISSRDTNTKQKAMNEARLDVLEKRAIESRNESMIKIISDLKNAKSTDPAFRNLAWKNKVNTITEEIELKKKLFKELKKEKPSKKIQDALDVLSLSISVLQNQKNQLLTKINKYSSRILVDVLNKDVLSTDDQVQQVTNLKYNISQFVSRLVDILDVKVELFIKDWKAKKTGNEPVWEEKDLLNLFPQEFIDYLNDKKGVIKPIINTKAVKELVRQYRSFLLNRPLGDPLLPEIQRKTLASALSDFESALLNHTDQEIPVTIVRTTDYTEGVVPKELSSATYEELYAKFQEVLRRIETLKVTKGYNGYVTEGIVKALLKNYFGDVDVLSFFKDALTVKIDRQNQRRLAENKVITANLTVHIQELLQRDVSKPLIELTPDFVPKSTIAFGVNPIYSIMNPSEVEGVNVVHFTINENNNIISIVFYQDKNGVLQKVTNTVPMDLTKDNTPDKLSSANIDTIIDFMLESQDSGSYIVSYDGSSTDFNTLHKNANNKDKVKAVALRSFDISSNIKKQRSASEIKALPSISLNNLHNITQVNDSLAPPSFFPGGFTYDGDRLNFNGKSDITEESFIGHALWNSLTVLQTYTALINNKKGVLNWRGNNVHNTETLSDIVKPVYSMINDLLAEPAKGADFVKTDFNNAKYLKDSIFTTTQKDATTGVYFDVLKIQEKLELHALATKFAETKEKMFEGPLLDKVNEGRKVYRQGLQRHKEGLAPIWKEMFAKDGYPIRFNFFLDTPDLNASNNYIYSQGEKGKQEYIEATKKSIVDRLGQIDQNKLFSSIENSAGFRPKILGESIEDYLLSSLNDFLATRFTMFKDYSSFGDGTLGYVAAQNLGAQLVDSLLGLKEGVVYNSEPPSDPRLVGMSDKFTAQGRNFTLPLVEDINHASVYALKDVEQLMEEWRVQKRREFIINNVEWLKDKGNQEKLEKYFSAFTKVPSPEEQVSPDLTDKNVRISPILTGEFRGPFGSVKNIAELKEVALHMFFNTPRLFGFYIHDAFYNKYDQGIFNQDSNIPTNFPTGYEHFHPGIATGLIGSSAAPFSLAWISALTGTIPKVALDLLAKQVDDAQYNAQKDKTPNKPAQKVDAKFSGRQLILATVFYSINPKQRGAWARTLESDMNVVYTDDGNLLIDGEMVKDPRHELRSFIVAFLKSSTTRTAVQNSLLTKLETLGSKTEKTKDLFKGVLLPRNYQGGRDAFIKMLTEKNEDLEKEEQLTVNEIYELADLSLVKTQEKNSNRSISFVDKALGFDPGTLQASKKYFESLEQEYATYTSSSKAVYERNKAAQEGFKKYVNAIVEAEQERQSQSGNTFTTENVKAFRKQTEERIQNKVDVAKKIKEKFTAWKESQEGKLASKEDVAIKHDAMDTEIYNTLFPNFIPRQIESMVYRNFTPLSINMDNASKALPAEFVKRYIAQFSGSLYFSVHSDSASKRQYTAGNSEINPQGKKTSQIITKENPLGMYDISEEFKSPDDIYSLLLAQLLLDRAPNYAPTIMGYDAKTTETYTDFYREVKRDSEVINTFRQKMDVDEFNKVHRDFRFKNTLNQKKENKNETVEVNTALLRPYSGFLPSHHNLDFSQVPNPNIQGLSEVFRNKKTPINRIIQSVRQIQQKAKEENNKDMIELKHRGHNSVFNEKDLPRILPSTAPYSAQLDQSFDDLVSPVLLAEYNQMQSFMRDYGLLDSSADLVNNPVLLTVFMQLLASENKGSNILTNNIEFRKNGIMNVIKALILKAESTEYFVGRLAREAGKFANSENLDQKKGLTVTKEALQKFEALSPHDKTYKNIVRFLLRDIARGHVFSLPLEVYQNIVDGTSEVNMSGKSETREVPVNIFSLEASVLVNYIYSHTLFKKLVTEAIQQKPGFVLDKEQLDSSGYIKDIQAAMLFLTGDEATLIFNQMSAQLNEKGLAEEEQNQMLFIINQEDSLNRTEGASFIDELQVKQMPGGSILVDTLVPKHIQLRPTLATFTSMLNLLANNATVSDMELAAQTRSASYIYYSNYDMLTATERDVARDRDTKEELGRLELIKALKDMWFLNSNSTSVLNIPIFNSSEGPVLDTLSLLSDVVPITLMVSQNDNRPSTIRVRVADMGMLLPLFKVFSQGVKLGLLSKSTEFKEMLTSANVNQDDYGLKKESNIMLKAAIYLSKIEPNSQAAFKDSIITYLFPTMTEENRTRLIRDVEPIVNTIRTIEGSTVLNNDHYRAALSILQKNKQNFKNDTERRDYLNNLPIFLLDFFKTGNETKDKTILTSLQKAVELAYTNFFSLSETIPPSGSVHVLGVTHVIPPTRKFVEPSKFLETFTNKEAKQMHEYLQSLVTQRIISPEIMDAKLLLIGYMAENNPSFFDDLHLGEAEDGATSYATAAKKAGKYTINLNSKMVQVTSENQIYYKFAEELIHIASVKYFKDGGKEKNRIASIFATQRSKPMIREMLLAMNSFNNQEELNEAVTYAMSNADEFFAHFGAYILVNNALINNKALINLKRKHKPVEDAMGWWQKAFLYISNIATRMGDLVNDLLVNPEYSDLFKPLLELTNTLLDNKAMDVSNPSGLWNASKTVYIGNNPGVQESLQSILKNPDAITNLKNLEKTFTSLSGPEQERAQAILEDPMQNPVGTFGLSVSQVYNIMDRLTDISSGKPKAFATWTSKEQKAFLTHLTWSLQRGDRMDSKGVVSTFFRKGGEGVSNFAQKALLSFNDPKYSYESSLAIVVSLAKLIDEHHVITHDTLDPKGTSGLYQKLLGLRYRFSPVYAELSRLKQGLSQEQHMVIDKVLLGVIAKDASTDLSLFTSEQTQTIQNIAKNYSGFLGSADILLENVGDKKVSTVREYDPIGTFMSAMNRTPEQVQALKAVLQPILIKKMLTGITEKGLDSSVAGPLLLHNTLLGLSDDTTIAKTFRARGKMTKARTAQEAILKKITLLIEFKQPGLSPEAFDQAFQTVKKEFIEDLSKNRGAIRSFKEVFQGLDTNEIQLILSAYTAILSQNPGSGTTLNNSSVMGYLGKDANEAINKNPEVKHDVDVLITIFLQNTKGKTFFAKQASHLLTYSDLKLNPDISENDSAIIDTFVSSDLNEIGNNYLEKTIYNVAERLMLADKLNYPGLTKEIDIMHIIDILSTNSDLLPVDPNSKRSNNQRAILESSLKRLTDALTNTRGTLIKEDASGLVGVANNVLQPIARYILSKNITLATMTVEGTSALVSSMFLGENPGTFLIGMLKDYVATSWHTNAMGIITPNNTKDGKLFFGDKPSYISAFGQEMAFMLGHIATPFLNGDVNLDPEGNLNVFRRIARQNERAVSVMSQVIYTALELSARRQVRQLLTDGSLMVLRDTYIELNGTTDTKDLNIINKAMEDSGVKVARAVVYKWIITGLFAPNVLETLTKLSQGYSSEQEFISIKSYADSRNDFIENKDREGLLALDTAWDAYVNASHEVTKLAITRDSPLDNTASSSASFTLLAWWKSYNSLYISQQVKYKSALVGPSAFMGQLMAVAMLDIMYMMALMLRQQDGYDKIQKMLRGKDMGGLLTLALRNPIFSANILNYLISASLNTIQADLGKGSGQKSDSTLMNIVTGKTLLNSIAESVAAQQMVEVSQAVATLYKSTIGNGSSNKERNKAVKTLQLFLPMLGDAMMRVLTQPFIENMLPGGKSIPMYGQIRENSNRMQRDKLMRMGISPPLNDSSQQQLRETTQRESINRSSGQTLESLRKQAQQELLRKQEAAKQKATSSSNNGSTGVSQPGMAQDPNASQVPPTVAPSGIATASKDPFSSAALAPNKTPAGI